MVPTAVQDRLRIARILGIMLATAIACLAIIYFSIPMSDTQQSQFDVILVLVPGARYLINPGSVGQPRDNDRRAAYALYDDERMMVEFRRVPYDFRLAQMRIMRAGLPDQLAMRLSFGR